MAYTDPNTGVTRDRYGNPLRDTPKSPNAAVGIATWIFAALIVAGLMFAMFGGTTSNDTVTSSPTNTQSSKQPATPSPAPATP
jgi:hypothetical protein